LSDGKRFAQLTSKRLDFLRNGLSAAAAVSAVLLLVGCVGSGVRGSGDAVRVVTAEQLQGCTNVGSAHVSVIDKLPQLQQIDGAVAGELVALASNSAVQLGGNALVEMTNIVDGRQSFAVFKCP
jgi:hypothetical protein